MQMKLKFIKIRTPGAFTIATQFNLIQFCSCCLLCFGINERNQMFIIENHFIVFQKIFTRLQCTLWDISKTCFFGCRKTLASKFVFHFTMFWVPEMRLFEPKSRRCENSHGRILESQQKSKWLCTTQNWLFCVVFDVWLQHVQFFRNNRWCLIRLILKYPYSRCFIVFNGVTIVGAPESFFFFISTNRLFDFVWTPTRRNCFYQSVFMQHWLYYGSTNALGCFNLTIAHDDLAISVIAWHQWFSKQQIILDDPDEIRHRVNYDHYWVRHSIVKYCSSIEIHPQKLNWVIHAVNLRRKILKITRICSCWNSIFWSIWIFRFTANNTNSADYVWAQKCRNLR